MKHRKWSELQDALKAKLGPEKWAEHERKAKEELERIQREEADVIPR